MFFFSSKDFKFTERANAAAKFSCFVYIDHLLSSRRLQRFQMFHHLHGMTLKSFYIRSVDLSGSSLFQNCKINI